MAIPNPNPNIADGIKSDNKTYSSNKIESLIKTATELPIPEADDAGKVLTVNSDSDGYELDYAGHDLIDDNTASSDTVYSSSKVDTLLGDKQDKSDSNLQTTDQTIVGAINYLNGLYTVKNLMNNAPSNINDCITGYVHWANGNVYTFQNLPTTGAFHIITFKSVPTHGFQIAIPNDGNKIWLRTIASGTWSVWKSVNLS